MRKLDEIDIKIIQALKKNSRTSLSELSKELGISKTAVKKRIEKLVKDGIITKFTIETGTGGGVKALVLVKTQPGTDSASIASQVSSHYNVDHIYEVTGDYDMVVLASAETIEQLNSVVDEIRRLPGVRETVTMIILKMH